jgi:signal transduction histidine kinase
MTAPPQSAVRCAPHRWMLPSGGWLPPLGGWLRSLRRWFRLPRRTVRLRLTMIYGGVFLLSGAALLTITYFLVAQRLPAGPVPGRLPKPSHVPSGTAAGISGGRVFIRTAGIGTCRLLTKTVGTPAHVAAQAQRCLAQQRALELNQLLTESGVALAIMTVLSIGLGWLVAGRALGKLRTITAAARSISANNLGARLALAGRDDELKELGDTIDGLLTRLEAAFGAQRQFVANASHELRTPLARQRTLIEVALADPEPSVAGLHHVFKRVLASGEQQEQLIEALLTLARGQRGLDRREPIDLAALAGEAVQARRAVAELRGLTITTSLGPAPALGDPQLTERLVANLLDNAFRHNVARGAIHVSTAIKTGHAVLSVSNTGPVISPGHLARLFQPFERGGAARTGTSDGLGLGLSIVAAIAEAHGAWLQASSLTDGGLRVQAGFPQEVCPPAATTSVRPASNQTHVTLPITGSAPGLARPNR